MAEQYGITPQQQSLFGGSSSLDEILAGISNPLMGLEQYGKFNFGGGQQDGLGINLDNSSAFTNLFDGGGAGLLDTDSAVKGRGGFKNFFLGEDGQQSQFGNIAGLANDLAGTYLGFKNYGLAKDSLDFQEDSFNKQYAAQRTAHNANRNQRFLNAELARGRGATGPSPYGTFEDYKARTNIQA